MIKPRWTVSTAVVLLLPLAPAGRRPPSVIQQTTGTTARLQAVSPVNDSVVWASGTGGTFVRTVDGGATWRAGVVPGADSLEFRDVHGFDARRAVLLAAGPGEKSRLYRTGDGGATWTLVFTNRDPARFYDCIDFRSDTGYAVSDAVGGRLPLLRTTDGGRSWSPWEPAGPAVAALEGEGAFAASGTCLTIHPDGSVWVGTATGGRAIRFADGGSAAHPTPIVRGSAAGVASIAFADAQVGIAAGGDLGRADEFLDNLIVTTDGGRTWTLGGRPPFTGAVYGVAVVPGRSGGVVAVGPKGAAWSDDQGRTWAWLDRNDYWGLGFSRSGAGWLVGPRGRIAKVTF